MEYTLDLLGTSAVLPLYPRALDLRGTSAVLPLYPRALDLRGASAILPHYNRTIDLRGAHRSAEELDPYRLYHAEDAAAMDWTTPADSGDGPFAHTPTAGALNRYVVRRVNRFGLESQNTAEILLDLTALGEEQYPVPSAPTSVLAEASAGGVVTIRAQYVPSEDPYPATRFAIWLTTTGVDPVTTGDPDITVTVSAPYGVAILARAATYVDATEVRAIVAMQRLDGATWRTSAESEVVTAIADAARPETPESVATINKLSVIGQSAEYYIYLLTEDGKSLLTEDGTPIAIDY